MSIFSRRSLTQPLGLFIMLAALLSVPACGTPIEPSGGPTLETVERVGAVNLPDHPDVQPGDLVVLTFAGSANVASDGTFSVPATETTTHQMVFVESAISGETVMIGLYDPATGEVDASLESTAEALLLLNPSLMGVSDADRRTYLDIAAGLPTYAQLVLALSDAYETNPHTVLEDGRNPAVYELAAATVVRATQLWHDAMAAQGTISERIAPQAVSDPPYVEDAVGPGFHIVNPRFIAYGAGIYPGANSLLDPPLQVVTVLRREQVLDFDGVTGPGRTDAPLGDGYYRLQVEKGGQPFVWDWNDPAGRATIVNTGHILLSIVELSVGAIDPGSIPSFVSLPAHLAISPVTAYELGKAIRNGDQFGILSGFLDLASDQAEGLKLWLWQEGDAIGLDFVEKASSLLKRVTVILQLLDFANGTGPFVFDLAFAPAGGTFYVTLVDGEIVSMNRNRPPVPGFTVSPEAGTLATTFEFDASSSTDDIDALTELEFRWDFDGDGTYETDWTGDTIAAHQFDHNGSFTVVLEVRDRSQQTAVARQIVNVGGGAGTADRVVLFRDVLPWDTNATVEVLEALGFVTGIDADGTYQVVPSSEMASWPLVPGRDLVIISNDQPQTFYENYAAADLRFRSFVSNGGALLWGACDRGWADGAMLDAGVVLPGGATIIHAYDRENFVRNPELPLVTGLPATLTHYYASHESFGDLPEGSTVYTVDTMGTPTLVEYNFGAGWVMLTGQPLEHQFANPTGDLDLELLLPRVIAHFTGRPAPAASGVFTDGARDPRPSGDTDQ